MMKICRLLYICCLWGVFSLSYGQHKTDWSRERLQKAIKTLRIKGYHVIENGAMAQKGALIAEMNLEKTFDSQGNILMIRMPRHFAMSMCTMPRESRSTSYTSTRKRKRWGLHSSIVMHKAM